MIKAQIPFFSAHEQTALPRQIAAKGRQIDARVYKLYALTEEETGICGWVEYGGMNGRHLRPKAFSVEA